MEVVLVRHALPARVEHATPGVTADPGLVDLGRQQADALAAHLVSEGIDVVLSSPLRRAVETAEPLAVAAGVPVDVDDDLAEFDRHSTWYVPVEELKASGDPRWQQYVDGTTLTAEEAAAFDVRVVAAVERAIDANPGRRVAVVSHGGIVNAYLKHVLGVSEPRFPFMVGYASVSRVRASRGGVRSVASVNETGHVRHLLPPP